MTVDRDPFEPVVPADWDIGRLLSTGRLEAGWPCRWCRQLLCETATSAVICMTCDPLEPPA